MCTVYTYLGMQVVDRLGSSGGEYPDPDPDPTVYV